MALSPALQQVKALCFDVFGTVVDWRTSIAREGSTLGKVKGIRQDWLAFADAWRKLYQPQMEKVRTGAVPWTRLDDLHRQSLEKLLGDFGIAGLSEAEVADLNKAWHRLDPWPDSVPGLTRLRRKYILATASNGNVALMVDLARWGGLPWDAILGAEVARAYKPNPEAYLRTAAFLDLQPHECMMVAAHNGDLVAASKVGLRTAFVARPTEHGSDQKRDLRAENDYDVAATSMEDLAAQLGCGAV